MLTYACYFLVFQLCPFEFLSPCCGTSVPYVQVNCIFMKKNMSNPEKELHLYMELIYLYMELIIETFFFNSSLHFNFRTWFLVEEGKVKLESTENKFRNIILDNCGIDLHSRHQ